MATTRKLAERQQAFVDYYVETMNAAEAARRAGYSAKNARKIGSDLLKRDYIQEAIQKRLEEIKSRRIADSTEVMEYLTAVMRGENESETIVTEGLGLGESRARAMTKHPEERERLKAAELLGKRYQLFTDKMQIDSNTCVQIIDDVDEDTENEAD